MPPVREYHGLSWRKGVLHTRAGSVGGDGEERVKQPRRSTPLTKRHSPSHSRTPSPNQQAPCASGMMATVPVSTHGHVFPHGGTRRSPSSKAGSAGSGSRSAFADSMVSGPREKRRASPDPTRKGYTHAHVSQRGLGSKSTAIGPPFKASSSRSVESTSWGASSPTPGLGPGRAISSPTLTGNSSSSRGHSSPTLGRGPGDAIDGQSQLPSASVHPSSMLQLPLPGSTNATLSPSFRAVEAREMTQLDRVFLEQSHESRKGVEGDGLDLCDEIQRHLQSRVQSQQSQLMEAASRNSITTGGFGVVGGGGISGSRDSGVFIARSRASFAETHTSQNFLDSYAGDEMELIDDGSCYSPGPVHDNAGAIRDPASFVAAQTAFRRGSAATVTASPVSVPLNGSDFLDDPDLGSAGVPPVSPSSGGGPAQGLVLDVGGAMDFFLDGADARGNVREPRSSSSATRSRSPHATAAGPDVQIGGDSGGGGGDGQLREVVSGLDAMDLDDVDRALALLTAQKKRIIAAKQYAGAAAAAVQAEAQAHANIVPPQPPPHSTSNGGTSSNRTGGGSSRQRRSSGRSRHGGEGSPSAGGRSEAFGVSGGGIRGAPTLSSRVPRGQGRPPPVPGHLLASTAAMRRSSPGSIASLAELDSYLEHHHRRLVEQVEGGGAADDVEAEIKASRQPQRGTRSQQRFGTGPGSIGFGGGSSSSSNSVPRTVGARVSTGSFFHSSLSADGERYDFRGRGSRPSARGSHKRERELRGPVSDGGVIIPGLRGFRARDEEEDDGDDEDDGEIDVGSAFMGVSANTHSQTSSPPPSIMSSADDVSVSSYGQGHSVTVPPGSPNNLTFARRPPSSLVRVRLEAVRSPVVRHGYAGDGRGEEEGPVFTSPDASKHVQELCSPRSAFTPRSASSVSSRASSPARRR